MGRENLAHPVATMKFDEWNDIWVGLRGVSEAVSYYLCGMSTILRPNLTGFNK